jgi:hypothetical protein
VAANAAFGIVSLCIGAVLFRSLVPAALFAAAGVGIFQLWGAFSLYVSKVAPLQFPLIGTVALLALALAGAVIGLMSTRALCLLSKVLAAGLLIMLLLPTGGLVVTWAYLLWHELESRPAPLVLDPPAEKPDIYDFLFDGYARADVLQGMFGLDNSPFLDELRKRGFVVADRASANYSQTVLSASTMLGLDYLGPFAAARNSNQPLSDPKSTLDPAAHAVGIDIITDFVWKVRTRLIRMLLTRRLHDAVVPTALAQLGYRLDSTPTVYSAVDPRWGVAVQDRPLCAVNLLEATYIRRTPLYGLCRSMGYGRGTYFRLVFTQAMTRGPVESGPPVFEFRHVLSPHPPFVLDTDGNFADPPRETDWRLADADTFIRDDPRRREEYSRGYARQVQGLNIQVLRTVDRLLKSRRPLIIVLHGDHGSGLHTSHVRREDTCLWERFSPLLAVYSSDGRLQQQIPDDLSLVNLYRIVFRTYFGSDMPLLPNRSFYAPFKDLSLLEPVKVTQPCVPKTNTVAVQKPGPAKTP